MLDQRDNERNVAIGGVVPHNQAVSRLSSEVRGSFEGIENAIPQFQKVTKYTTFAAEYALIDNDIVVHFFLPPEQRMPEAYDFWATTFPNCLDVTARSFFNADYPRLVAKYTEEMTSWWFRANGFGHVLDLDALVQRFFAALDGTIDANVGSGP